MRKMVLELGRIKNEETDRLIRNALGDNCYHNNEKGT